MGIYDGAGIHGTADVGSLGTAASHGCIRMAVPDVEELYDQVPRPDARSSFSSSSTGLPNALRLAAGGSKRLWRRP